MKIFSFIMVFVFCLHAQSIPPLPTANFLSSSEKSTEVLDITALKILWKARINAILAQGIIPF